MSILDEAQDKDITDFPGPDQLLDEEDLAESPQSVCLSARNVEYLRGQVRIPRRGFTQVWNPAKGIRFMYNWVTSSFNRLVYLNSDNSLISRDLSNGTETTLLSNLDIATLPPVGMSPVQDGFRLIVSFFANNGRNVALTAKIWDGTLTSGTPNIEPVFHGPLLITELVAPSGQWQTATVTGTGVTTPGSHFVAVVVTTWNGYQTAPGPIQLNTFAGGEEILGLLGGSLGNGSASAFSVTITPRGTWPAWVRSVQLAMTPNVATASIGVKGEGLRWFLLPGQKYEVGDKIDADRCH